MSTTTLAKAGTKNVEQVILLDASTGDPASLGGGTQYADGTAVATPTGTQINFDNAGTQTAVSDTNPLPVSASINTAGLATEAKQDAAITQLTSIAGEDFATQTTLAALNAKVTAVNTGAVVVSSSALPSGAATSAKQDDIITAIGAIPGGGGVQYTEGDTDASITGTALMMEGAANALVAAPGTAADGLLVNLGANNDVTVSGVSTAANQTTMIGHLDGVEGLLGTIDTDTGGIATSTASLDTKTPALGQALAAASVPVVLTAAQITTLTPVSTVTANLAAGTNNIGDVDILTVNGQAPAFGTGTRSAATQRVTIATDDVVPASQSGTWNIGTVTTLTGITNALPAGTNAIGKLAANSGVDIGDVDVTSVNGFAAHDAAIAGNPLIVGGVSSAAAPASVSADQEAVRAWYLRNGAQATVLTAAGALIGGDASNGLDVDVTRLPALAAGTNNIGDVDVLSLPAIPAGNNNIGDVDVASIAAGDNNIGNVDIVSGTITTVSTVSALGTGTTGPQKAEDVASAAGDMGVAVMAARLDTPVANAGVSNDGDYTTPILDNFRKLWTTASYPEDLAHVAGEAVTGNGVRRIDTAATSAGSSGDWATMDASAEGALWGTLTPTTTSGCTIFRSIDLDETEEEVKATAGNIYGYYYFNSAATTHYLKFYNATTANTTVGTTTPILTFPMPAGAAANIGFPYPLSFSTALSAAVTTGLADNDTGAPAASACIVNVFYK
jgi:hypothetical protein